ncbi:hypothetical protein [Achromobacter xylosoxidans]|uniref:hypothetical protein n=1 Tax=Alcaligenes xylosoxydans xylosoxydans TaxID=85698 RepID=UPI001F138AB4|nr:hypothetical protein [Achromobacter xylosoxidans]
MKTTVLILCAFLAGVTATLVARPPAKQDVMTCRQVEGNTIDAPGAYCLSADRRAGLTIKASDVSLDLRGYCIMSPEGKGTTSSGIELAPGASRVSITGGCIQGFFYGIRAEDAGASDIRVTGVSFAGQTFRGVSFRPQKVVVKKNTFRNIGGTTVYPDAYAMAVEIHGRNCSVSDNQISNFYPTGVGEGVGISISDHDNNSCTVVRNLIRNDSYPKAGRTFGIWSSNKSVTIDNVVINMTYGIAPNYTKGNYIIDEACDGLNFAAIPDDDYEAGSDLRNAGRLHQLHGLLWRRRSPRKPGGPASDRRVHHREIPPRCRRPGKSPRHHQDPYGRHAHALAFSGFWHNCAILVCPAALGCW